MKNRYFTLLLILFLISYPLNVFAKPEKIVVAVFDYKDYKDGTNQANLYAFPTENNKRKTKCKQ